jgi:biopolymer transport protein ExbD
MQSLRPSAVVTPEINVAPLIDVLLVLFIVYLVILSLGRQTIRVQIPPDVTASRSPQPPAIVLELPDAGGFRLNGHSVPDWELETRLHEIFDRRTVKVLYLAPGASRSYEQVIQAMDRARGAGVLLLGFIPRFP